MSVRYLHVLLCCALPLACLKEGRQAEPPSPGPPTQTEGARNTAVIEIPAEGLGKPTGATFSTLVVACEDGIEEIKRDVFLKDVEDTFMCKAGSIAIPEGDWSCKPEIGKSETDELSCEGSRQVGCIRGMRCIEETEAYNRAKLAGIFAQENPRKSSNEYFKSSTATGKTREEEEEDRREAEEWLEEERRRVEAVEYDDSEEARAHVAYLDHLKTCSPFSFAPELFGEIFGIDVTLVIVGRRDGKCAVEQRGGAGGDVLVKCLYQDTTVRLMTTPLEYEKAKKGMVLGSSASELSQEMGEDCEPLG